MKKGIHPDNYRPVVFKDSASGAIFVTRSCARTQDTIRHEGKELPLVLLGISSESHPFYTGQQRFVDTAGRVDKFNKRFANVTPPPKKTKKGK
jgi:large subunit ribosomal protein L31